MTRQTRPLATPLHERLVGAAGAALVVAGLGYALIVGLAVHPIAGTERPMVVVDLPRPPAPPPPPRAHPVARPRQTAASAAPPNLRSTATEIVAVEPLLPLPIPPPIVAAPIAGAGTANSIGATDRSGPGRGAGGEGNGSGEGGNGEGEGGDSPPRLLHGRLKAADLPRGLLDSGAGGAVMVRYDVEIDGRVTGCRIIESSGQPELDRLTCALIEQRFRFAPSRTDRGEPVRSTVEETHDWVIDLPAPRR